MRYQPLPAGFHAGRRAAYREQLEPGSVAIIDTNPQLVRSRDVDMPYRPDSYFYYLTGIDQPEGVLVMTPTDEALFIRETSDQMRVWDGEAFTPSEATKLSGIKHVQSVAKLDEFIETVLAKAQTVYLNYSDPAAAGASYAPGARRAARIRTAHPDLVVQSARPALAALRMVKQPGEISHLRRAIGLTAAGFKSARGALAPGIMEYQLEAELAREIIAGGGSGYSFEPVIAGGARATVMHYIANDHKLASGSLVLLDMGAEYGWYASDIARTWPVDGTFTPRQEAVYRAVLDAQRQIIGLMAPGITLVELERRTAHIITEALVALKVVTAAEVKADPKLYRRFYPHAVGHHLGLDVHDVGDISRPLEPGMVITCEPGIYLAGEGIGVRLEDDILITPTGNENLSAAIPREF